MQTVAAIVARNVAELRTRRKLSVRDLSARLAELGYKLLASGVSKIENGERRVDVTDLVALAVALEVSPVRLLLPLERADVELTPKLTQPWSVVWRWAVGEQPLGSEATPLTDPRVKPFRAECRPFEDASSIREAARVLVSREPVPFDAHIRADSAGRAKTSLTWGDNGDDDDAG